MASGNSFCSFVTGMVFGAAIALLTCTERGHELVQEFQKKSSDFLNSDTDGEDEDVCQSED
ncbi:MAG: YtxH domain-containing protein [Bacteroidales bacterium]|nr:YtxH domain-containing protein [Bacteroidales bacterium]